MYLKESTKNPLDPHASYVISLDIYLANEEVDSLKYNYRSRYSLTSRKEVILDDGREIDGGIYMDTC
jgi:hypothetical protein